MRIDHFQRISFLWRFVRPRKLHLLLALFALAFVSLTSLLYPWLLKLMVDQFGGQGSSPMSIDLLCLLLATIFIASTILGYYQQVEMRALGFRLRNDLRIAFYDSLLSMPLTFHRRAQVGELSSRATEDIGKLQLLFPNLVSPAFQNVLFASGCVFLMVKLNWLAALLVIGLVALPIPFIIVISKKLTQLTARSQTDHAQANAFLEESLVAVREIKAYVREQLESRRYAAFLDRALATEKKASRLNVKVNQTVYLIFSGALLAIFYTGTRRTFLPHWSLGDVIAFYFYSYTMTMAVLSTGKIYLTYQELAAALGRIMDLFVHDNVTAPTPHAYSTHPVRGEIEFRNVSFSYGGSPTVVRNVSFRINPGDWYLITGASGSGKSTLASLLLGLYLPLHGSISIDDIPLDRWDLPALRRQIGYVGQDPILIHGTLRENIDFTGSAVHEQQLARAVELSCLSDVLNILPNGLDSLIGERGYTLSGGQKARVAIARAIIHDPPVLVLDEANAMLEEETEKRLWQNLVNSRSGKTTVIFSHHSQHIPEICSVALLRNGILTLCDGNRKTDLLHVHSRLIPELEK